MAKDRKNKNTIEGKYSEIIKSHKVRDRPTKSERESEDYYQTKQSELEFITQNLSESKFGSPQYDEYLLDIGEVSKEAGAGKEDYYQQKARRQKQSHKILQQTMHTATTQKNLHEQVNVRRHSIPFDEAYQASQRFTQSGVGVLEKEVYEGRSSLDRQRIGLQRAAERLAPGDDIKPIEHRARNLDRAIAEHGKREAALDMQRRMGEDSRGVFSTAQGAADRAKGRISHELTKAGIESGKISGSDIEKRLATASEELIKAQKAWSEALESGKGDVTQLGNAAKVAAEKAVGLEKQFEVAKEVGATGFAGSKFGRGLGKAAQVMQTAGNVVNAGADIYSQWAIGQDMDKSRLRGQLMDVANQRFDDARAASQGDMAAVMRLGRYAESAHFGQTISGKAENAAIAGAVGSGLSAVGSGIEGGLKGGMIGGGWGALGGFINSAAAGVAQTSGQIAKLQSGAVGAQAFLDAEATKRGELSSMDYMTAAVRQTAMDHTRKSWSAAAGSGSNAGDILKTTRDSGFLGNMALTYGLDLDRVNSLTQAGVGSLGKQFKTENMADAAGAYRASILSSPEEYMQMSGQMSQAGGTNKDLQQMLKAAVASGMDSSKNIAEMVRSIGNLSAGASVGGYSTFGGTATRTEATIEALKNAGIAENQRAGSAEYITSRQNDILKNRGNTVEDFWLSYKMLEGGHQPGQPGSEALATMESGEAQTMMGILEGEGTDEEKHKRIKERGFRSVVGKTAEETKANIRKQAGLNLQKTILKEAPKWAWGGEHSKEGVLLMDVAQKQIDGKQIDPQDMNKAQEIWAEMQRAQGKPVTPFNAWTISGDVNNKPTLESFATGASADPLRGKGQISSGWGPRTHPTTGEEHKHHDGVDIKAPEGTPIMSPVTGKVESAGYNDVSGHFVRIKDEHGNTHKFAHMKKASDLKAGQEVTEESQIGEVGSTGRSTGPHLHYGLEDKTGKSVDPFGGKGLPKSKPTDVAVGADMAGALGKLTEYNKGLESVNGRLDILVGKMAIAATQLDPEKFKALRDSSGDLDKSVANLVVTVNALNLKLKGDDGGANKELERIRNNSSKEQGKKGASSPGATGNW